MLKFLETRDEVVELAYGLAEQTALKSFRIGVAGSYVTNMNKKGSSIDIVLKLKDGEDRDLIGDLDIDHCIRRYITDSSYSNKIHIIWLDLLEADEEALLKFIGTEGVENNPESVYTNIVGEVRWVDENDDEEDEDDRISSSVVTYDEEEDE